MGVSWHENAKAMLQVTGTSRRTTTTNILGRIMRSAEGYVGDVKSYTQAAPKMTEESVTVAEISSFQLGRSISSIKGKCDLKYHRII